MRPNLGAIVPGLQKQYFRTDFEKLAVTNSLRLLILMPESKKVKIENDTILNHCALELISEHIVLLFNEISFT